MSLRRPREWRTIVRFRGIPHEMDDQRCREAQRKVLTPAAAHDVDALAAASSDSRPTTAPNLGPFAGASHAPTSIAGSWSSQHDPTRFNAGST